MHSTRRAQVHKQRLSSQLTIRDSQLSAHASAQAVPQSTTHNERLPALRARKCWGSASAQNSQLTVNDSRREQVHEQRLNPDDLKGRHKRRLDKEERMASVLAGREGRDKFGASIGRKKQKTGGLTEKEKQKRKAMPLAARAWQVCARWPARIYIDLCCGADPLPWQYQRLCPCLPLSLVVPDN
eukprot:361687-Chlamydomonas_euryale.AAC.2